jgi:2-polyprenyl-3-methyl-5-hydroxy-6-metoxy-1,4-benzoquinol methylase
MNLRDTYDRIAEDWVRDNVTSDWWSEGTDAFLSFVPEGGTVLDVGCAGGAKTAYMADKGYLASGIDISPKMIEIAKRDFPGLPFDVADLFDLDSGAEQYDGISVQAVLLHVAKADVPQALDVLVRRLLPGGHLYVSVKEVRDDRPEEGIRKENEYGYEFERFFSYYRADELRSFMEKAGLEVVWEAATPAGRAVWLQAIGRRIV